MSEVAIRADVLSKRYRIGRRERYYTLRDTVAGVVSAPFRRLWGNAQTSALKLSSQPELIWALKDVSFEIKQGEVVGIVGRNGAGKSTLLKILSRITEPSEGEVRIYGRVGSLLEVGTGFHPELSGRENIYLNGAILGMREREIDHKFDEIVAFAEVEKFLDTPVKHYSSGMYMRLAFSVAAHLDSDILLIDEVLAVGDAPFQEKCLGKMGDLANGGRAVLFVSHNLRAVQQLCTRTIWLDGGSIAADGLGEDVVLRYLKKSSQCETPREVQALIRQLDPDTTFRLYDVAILQDGERVNRIANGSSVEIEFRYEVFSKVSGLRVFFDLCDTDGSILFRSFHDDDAEHVPVALPGRYVSRASIPPNLLSPRAYELRIHAGIHNVRSLIPEPGIRVPLIVTATGRVNRAYVNDSIRGKLAPSIPWVTEPMQKD
jgi:lipopolysaccharide transport system ATP-binding protein